MRFLFKILGVLSIALGLGLNALGQERLALDDNLLVFVGQKISVEEFEVDDRLIEEPIAGTDEAQVTLIVDSGAKAHYRVLEVILGDYDEDEIRFTAWDHYGRFSFSEPEYVLLYVWKTDDGYVHAKYTYDEVFQLRSGGFAGCGNPYVEYGFEERSRLDPVALRTFDYVSAPEIGLSDVLLPNEPEYEEDEEPWLKEDLAIYYWEVRAVEDEASAIYSPPTYEYTGPETMICKMGVPVEALVDARWKTSFLPNLRRGECTEELGLDGWRDVKQREARQEKLDACIADKMLNDGRE